jgi:N-acetylmuramate 1-kinase
VNTVASSDSLAELLTQAGCALDLPRHGWTVTALAGDGSDRRFFRVRHGEYRFVALLSPRRNPSGIDENDSYWFIGRHLHALGVSVPRIHWADRQAGYFLLQDLGDRHLQRQVQRPRSRRQLRGIYQEVLKLLIGLHSKAPRGFSSEFCFDTPVYDAPFVYRRELEYFRNAFLVGYLGLEVDAEDLRMDFEHLAETAGADCGGLVLHRDFQSRNLMVHQGRLWLIDFQGMRFGPPAYDLAALLIDPYVMLPANLQEELAALYWSAAQRFLPMSRRVFREQLLAVRLCRNLQVLGAYGYLGKSKGKRDFLQYIPGAWQQLLGFLHGPGGSRYPRLRRLVVSAAAAVARSIPGGKCAAGRDQVQVSRDIETVT